MLTRALPIAVLLAAGGCLDSSEIGPNGTAPITSDKADETAPPDPGAPDSPSAPDDPDGIDDNNHPTGDPDPHDPEGLGEDGVVNPPVAMGEGVARVLPPSQCELSAADGPCHTACVAPAQVAERHVAADTCESFRCARRDGTVAAIGACNFGSAE